VTVVATGFGDEVTTDARGPAPPVRTSPREPRDRREAENPFGDAPIGDFEIPSFVHQPEE